jgi:putative spermidine/putrescine transport system permease protein
MTRSIGTPWRPSESIILRLSALAVAGFLLLPVAFIVIYSFEPGIYFSFSFQGASLRWFANFFGSERFTRALRTSLLIGGLVTPLSLCIGLAAAIALVRGRLPGRETLNAVFLSPLIIPGVVTGIAFLSLFSQLDAGSAFLRIVIAMVCFTLPFAIRSLVANLHGLPIAVEEAARNLGATPWQTFLHVVLPQLRPGLLAGSIFVFVEAIDNFSIAVFLTDTRTSTLPVEAFSYIRDFDDPTVAAMATLMIALSAGFLFIAERLIGLDEFLRLN